VRYVVQPGDTLGRIAACRGTSVPALARANRISAPDHLLAGAVLRVPEADGCAGPRGPVASPPPPGGGADVHQTVTDLLARALDRYDAADFEQALALSQAGVVAIEPHPEGAEADALRARCHMVSGMAAAGLGQREHAIAEFREALALAPDLPLDPERSSPRVLELVEAARASPSAEKAPFVDSSTR
jgi:LysM repeat protein